jgi:D-alanyl-D-alanine carboxypeptidase
MSTPVPKRRIHPKYFYMAAIVLLLGACGYIGYLNHGKTLQIAALYAEQDRIHLENASTTADFQNKLDIASSTIADLSGRLSLTADQLSSIEDDYKAEKQKNDGFEDQISQISGTVGVLDKLSKTDKELLQKYSKVYFLNEHYIPEKIVPIDKKYLYTETVSKSIHAKVEPYMSDMIDAALDDGVKLWVVSAYRSFGEQAGLKGAYIKSYGTGANTFSADQGYSEHQLGTTIDFTTEGINGGLDGFDTTKAYIWMQKNAYRYGFTLSYPKGNTYYTFEPWHWRFVGIKLATDLHKSGDFFYDWDQRKIDTYLISIFD